MAIAQRTKIVSLTFKREALLYDIKNYAFVEGDIMQSNEEHSKHQVFDIAEDGNIDRVTRILDLAYAECVEFMYPYTKIECEEEEFRDNNLEEASTYEIKLLVPNDFSQTTVTLINKYAHEYMVCRVLADWLSITKPNSKANWEDKMNQIQEKIQTQLNARCKRIRRAQTPF